MDDLISFDNCSRHLEICCPILYPDLLPDGFSDRPAYEAKTLHELCCYVILFNASFFKSCVERLPTRLLHKLFGLALQHGKDRALEVLLSIWPDEELDVFRYYDKRSLLRCHKHLYQHFKRIENLVVSSTHSFVKLATANKLDKLRKLDISGFPVYLKHAKPVFEKLLKISETTDDKCRPRKRIKVISGSFQSSAHETERFLSAEYILRVNCSLLDVESFDTLNRLQQCNAERLIRLCINHLQIANLGEKSIVTALKWPCLEGLRGLDISHNVLRIDGARNVIRSLDHYELKDGLVSLDLGKNHFSRSSSDRSKSDAEFLIDDLPRLESLRLDNNYCANSLSRVLKNNEQLSAISLSGCDLKLADLRHLLTMSLTNRITHLDLSQNCLADPQRMRMFGDAMFGLESSLRKLEVDRVWWTESHVVHVGRILSRLVELRCLSMTCNAGIGAAIIDLVRLPEIYCISVDASPPSHHLPDGLFANKIESEFSHRRAKVDGRLSSVHIHWHSSDV